MRDLTAVNLGRLYKCLEVQLSSLLTSTVRMHTCPSCRQATSLGLRVSRGVHHVGVTALSAHNRQRGSLNPMSLAQLFFERLERAAFAECACI